METKKIRFKISGEHEYFGVFVVKEERENVPAKLADLFVQRGWAEEVIENRKAVKAKEETSDVPK